MQPSATGLRGQPNVEKGGAGNETTFEYSRLPCRGSWRRPCARGARHDRRRRRGLPGAQRARAALVLRFPRLRETAYMDGGYTFAPLLGARRPRRPAHAPERGRELVRYGAEHFGARRLPTLSFGVRVLVRTPLRARAQRSRMSIPPAEREQQGRKQGQSMKSSD